MRSDSDAAHLTGNVGNLVCNLTYARFYQLRINLGLAIQS